jgi:hypothetical protein
METFVEDTQERREQVFNQQNEDVIEEQEPEQDDEVSTCAPPSDEGNPRALFSCTTKVKMRLVVSTSGIPMTPCSLIQKDEGRNGSLERSGCSLLCNQRQRSNP